MKHFEFLLTLSRNSNVRIVSVKFAINPEMYIEITIFNTSIYVATITKVIKQSIIRYINVPQYSVGSCLTLKMAIHPAY